MTVQTRVLESRPSDLAISITDSGIGITPDELASIFNAFTQGEHAHAGKAHQFGGLGLGLAISRMLVEFHSGTIRATSEGRDRGSTFTITLPLAPEPGGCVETDPATDPASASDQREELFSNVHVLLVEDHEPTRVILTHMLARRRFQVTAAASATEARACSQRQAFRLLISDIGLPDGTGFDLMRELRAANPALAGIALTGYGLEEDIARSHEVGFEWHLTKPVRVQSLDAALAAALAPGRVPDRAS